MLLELIHVQDNNLRIEARISPGREYVIGRKSDEIVPDIDLMQLGQGKQGISRRHAALKLDGDTLFIKDLGSTNATFVEGKRLRGSEQLAVKSGDRIQMGNLLLTIHFRDETNTE
jgi:pSer/pThr/pTyr-binding forkhead associated (FHA) protein